MHELVNEWLTAPERPLA